MKKYTFQKQPTLQGGQSSQPAEDSIDKSLLKDDLYKAVNGRWEKTAEIPADHSSTGGFMDLNDNIDKQLMKDLDDIIKENEHYDAPFSEFLKCMNSHVTLRSVTRTAQIL